MVTARFVMPGHRNSNSSAPVPFTYINSTFINGLNLWPATEYANWVPSRNQAQATWEAVMPDYTHQYIDSTQLSFWSGAIHCITRTIPAGTPAQWVGEGTCGADDVCAPPAGGYDGGCSPGLGDADICYGPEWECACNNCDLCGDEPVDPPTPPGGGCDGVTWQGCCDGDQLKWCQGGQLQTQSCPFFAGCGWNGGDGYYNCGGTGEDPTGTNPIACPSACTPDCGGKTCGDDGCGGSCGTCAAGETCGAGGTCEGEPPGPDAGGGADSGGTADSAPGEDTAGPGEDTGAGESDAGASGEVALDGGTPPPGVNPIQGGNTSGCASAEDGPGGAIGLAMMLLLLATFRRRRAL